MDSLERRLAEQLQLSPRHRLFVGFSGGLDSTVLLHVAAGLGAQPTALHVNHGLHPAAAAWERHCAKVCQRLGTGFASRRPPAVGKSEAEARAARYQAFDDLLEAGDLLLLAHHQDDQAETVLLRLLQGRGSLGMPRARRLPCGARILRPWLTIPRARLLAHARQAGLDWLDDPANAALAWDRNFLRHRILPQLAARWPGMAAALSAGAQNRQARDTLLAHLLHPTAGHGSEVAGAGANAFDLAAFPEELRTVALRLWLGGFGEFAVADRALAEFVRQLDSPTHAQPELSLARGALRRHRNLVRYVRRLPKLQPSYRLDPPGELSLPQGRLTAGPAGAQAGFHALGSLEIRFRRGGERLLCQGKLRSVKKLLHSASVPPWERGTYPLVYGNGQLLAIPDIAVADTPDRQPRWHIQWRPA